MSDKSRLSQKLRDSCDSCAKSKVRCDKEKPICGRCQTQSLPCHFSPARRMGKPRASSSASFRQNRSSNAQNNDLLSRQYSASASINESTNARSVSKPAETFTVSNDPSEANGTPISFDNMDFFAVHHPQTSQQIPSATTIPGDSFLNPDDLFFDTHMDDAQVTYEGTSVSTAPISHHQPRSQQTSDPNDPTAGCRSMLDSLPAASETSSNFTHDLSYDGLTLPSSHSITSDILTNTSNSSTNLSLSIPEPNRRSSLTAPVCNDRRDCIQAVQKILAPLHAPSSTCTTSLTPSSSSTNGMSRRPIDSVLTLNRAAIETITAMQKCSCFGTHQLNLLMCLAIIKVLHWHQAIVSDMKERRFSASSASSTPSSLLSTPSRIAERVHSLPIHVGTFAMGREENDDIILQLILNELQKIGRLIAALRMASQGRDSPSVLDGEGDEDGGDEEDHELTQSLVALMKAKVKTTRCAVLGIKSMSR